MLRRDFLALSSTAFAAGFSLDPRNAHACASASAGDSRLDDALPNEEPVLGGPPVLQSPAADGMTVVQGVRALSTAWVEYGTTKALGQRADAVRHGLLPLDRRVQRVRLSNLTPATTYYYRVGVTPIDFRGPYAITRQPDQYSKVYSFRTLSDQGSRASFLVINDTHERMETLRGLSGQLAAARARHASEGFPASPLLFWNGDLFDDVQSDEQIASNILTPPIASDVPGAEEGYASTTPMCFVSGNHDVRGIHARMLERFVETPGGVRYGVIRHGPIAFIVLDTGEDKPDEHPVYAGLGLFDRYRKEQAEWLAQVLHERIVTSATHRVVIQHIPLWGKSSSEGARNLWAKLLADAKVTLVISGHTHQHSFLPNTSEQPFAQLTGGGPAPESATLIEGMAEGSALTLTVRGIDGSVRGVHGVVAR